MSKPFNCEIKKTKMYEEIADKLEKMILSDLISVDEKLPSEQALATSFGVSRPVVREALMLLNARGLITQRNGEGAYVSRPTSDTFAQTMNRIAHMSNIDLSSLFEVRLALEVFSAQMAAMHASLEDIAGLETLIDEMEKSRSDNAQFAELDTKFHTQIAHISGNEILYIFIHSLSHQIYTMIEDNLVLEGANDDALRYHTRITEAIRLGSPEQAADLMRSHIIMSMRNAETVKKQSKASKVPPASIS